MVYKGNLRIILNREYNILLMRTRDALNRSTEIKHLQSQRNRRN